MHSGQRFRLDTGRWTATQCDAGFGAQTSCVRTGPSGAAIRTACELDERRSSGMMTSSDRGQQAAWQDLHGGAAPCETAAGSAVSSSPDTRAFGQGRGGRAGAGAGVERGEASTGASSSVSTTPPATWRRGGDRGAHAAARAEA
jgi:hypothetical protein